MDTYANNSIRGYAYASLIVSILLVFFTGFFVTSNKPLRSVIGYSAFLAALVSLVSCILSLTVVESIYMDYILTSLYSSFTHLTILYAFDRLSKNNANKISQNIVYFSYFWILVTIGTGLALTIIIAKELNDHFYYFSEDGVSSLAIFFTFSSWMFVIIIWILFSMFYRKLSKQSSGSMIAFAVLITVENICLLIFTFSYSNGVSGLVLLFIFIKLPFVAAIMIAVGYGSYWIKDSDYSESKFEVDNYNDVESSFPVQQN